MGRVRRGGYEPDFVVERKVRGVIERAIVEVKAECKATRAHVVQLNKYVRNLSGAKVRIVEKALVYPAGADTSEVPSDISLRRVNRCKCSKEDVPEVRQK